MKLEIKYSELTNVINLLDRLKLRGIQSIHRTRLSRKLTDELNRVAEEQIELQKEYFDEVDENGLPVVDLKKCKDKDEYLKAMQKFLNETVIIDSEESQTMLKSVKEALETSDLELSGKDAYTYEYLYTQLEKTDDSSSEEKSERD